MESRQLDRLLRIFSSLLLPVAAGCGAGTIDEDQFTEDLCGSGYALRILDAVEPAEPLDYLELRDATGFGPADMREWTINALDSSGGRCAGATDMPACLDAYDALPVESEFSLGAGFDGEPTYRSVGLTRGDDVQALLSRDGVLGMLGSIDAPGDAALVALLDGHQLMCDDGNNVGADGEDYVIHTRTGDGCGNDIEEHVVLVHPDGTTEVIQTVVVERGQANCAAGRLPAGLCASRRVVRAADPVGSYLAQMAYLEAAAVPAFGQLARELRVHGAPRSMVRAALRSRRDEIRHARVTARLARRFGGRPTAPRVDAPAARPLEEVVADNAAEGCIRETFGALVAHAQARRARDPQLRRALRRIAVDETRHAALSWDLAGWAEARMSVEQRRRVARTTANALDRLEQELTQEHHARVHDVAGLPTPDQAAVMYGGLRRTLFDA